MPAYADFTILLDDPAQTPGLRFDAYADALASSARVDSGEGEIAFIPTPERAEEPAATGPKPEVQLKGSSPQIKKHFMSAMSQRASEMLSEDMQALGPVRIRDVQHAQQALIATARQMNEAGEISLQGGLEEFVE